MTKDLFELPDVENRELAIYVGPQTREDSVAELSLVGAKGSPSWSPNALQLRALRDRCNAILAQHAAKDVAPGPYRVVRLGDVGAEIIKIESGSDIPNTNKAAVIRIDIEGNEDGPAWIGGLDDLAHLASAIDDVWDRYNPPPETVVKSLAVFATATAANANELQEALDSMRDGVVADDAGNLCRLDGRVIATADDPSQVVWLKRIAAIVNAAVEARGES